MFDGLESCYGRGQVVALTYLELSDLRLIGIDIGTTSVSGVLVDIDRGQVVDSCTRANASTVLSSQVWEHLQNPALILNVVNEVLQTFVLRHGPVDALSVTGQMHGLVYVDVEGNAVSPLFTWQDARGDLPCGSSTYRQVVTELSQHAVSTGYGSVTHFYLQHNNAIPQDAVKFCTIADFIAMKLGKQSRPVTDATNAAGIGLFDVSAGAFDLTAVTRAGIDPAFLPMVVPSGTFIGETSEGTAVYVGMGDNQASFLGSVKYPVRSLLVNLGTGGQVSLYRNQPSTLPGWETRPFPGGGFLWVGASLSGGKSYAMLERFFRQVCSLFTGSEPGPLYEKMNEVLETLQPLSDPLVVHTQFFGTRVEANRRGAILNISADNWTPQQLMVGFVEGMVDELMHFYELVPQRIKASISACIGSGNAIRNNPFLRRTVEARTGYPLQIPIHREEAAVGAAICAGVGHGSLKGFEDGSQLINYHVNERP